MRDEVACLGCWKLQIDHRVRVPVDDLPGAILEAEDHRGPQDLLLSLGVARVLAGKRNTDIAHELFLSLKTVESHTRNIKLGVSSRVEFITRLSQRDRDPFERPTSTAAPDPAAE